MDTSHVLSSCYHISSLLSLPQSNFLSVCYIHCVHIFPLLTPQLVVIRFLPSLVHQGRLHQHHQDIMLLNPRDIFHFFSVWSVSSTWHCWWSTSYKSCFFYKTHSPISLATILLSPLMCSLTIAQMFLFCSCQATYFCISSVLLAFHHHHIHIVRTFSFKQ